MFVIMQSLDNLKSSDRQENNIPQNIGQTMKHAGVAITVTSMTDIVVFAVGSSTVSAKKAFGAPLSSYFYLILLLLSFRNFPHSNPFAYTAQWGFLLCLYFKLLYLWRVSLWIYDGLKAIGTAFLYATNIAITPQTTTTTN